MRYLGEKTSGVRFRKWSSRTEREAEIDGSGGVSILKIVRVNF